MWLKFRAVEEILLPLEEMLFPASADVAVLSLDVENGVVRVGVRSTAAGAVCPGCGERSNRVHGSYQRFPADVPSAGRRVLLCLRVRRFTCGNRVCERRTFVEQIPGLTRRHGQRTERLRSTLAAVGLALAGRASARLAHVFGVPVSRSTVLRLVEALPDPRRPAPRVVGVDEYALRKGRIYGTVLVDVETRRPVDLLPDREADTLAAWLAQRPGIELICRDRANFYAEGSSRGAPQAVQVADRWHLWHNLAEAAEKSVFRHRGCMRAALTAQPPENHPDETATKTPESSSPWRTGHRFADRTRARHAAVHALLVAGHSKRSIARQLGMGGGTVIRSSRAATPEEPFTGQWQNRRSRLAPYKPYLHQRWEEGHTNAWALWEETRKQGYPDGYASVRDYIGTLRVTPQPVGPRPPTARTVTGWILTRPDSLPEHEHLQLKAVLAHCPELDALAGHVRAFAHMLTHLEGEQLPQWIDAAGSTDLPNLQRFAKGLQRDLDAAIAGLTPAMELRRRRRTRQPHQDAKTPDVRPSRLPTSPETSPSLVTVSHETTALSQSPVSPTQPQLPIDVDGHSTHLQPGLQELHLRQRPHQTIVAQFPDQFTSPRQRGCCDLPKDLQSWDETGNRTDQPQSDGPMRR
ncbi:ISL3 family transposase [Streptomyces sp. NPDC004610]|uniref:ISL3 family transposase n=1 Tax=unclassified Streptomyces TaxID=2593676 RepID=UPI0033A71E05